MLKNKNLSFLSVLAVSATLFGVQFVSPINNVLASGVKIGGNGYQCLGNETNRWKTDSENSATLPSGYTLDKVVVKAGQDCKEVLPTNNFSNCYSVSVNGNSVLVTKIGSGNTCKDISHLEGTYGVAAASVPASASPTPSASPIQTASPSATPSATPVASPSVTPSPAVTVTPTPTPDPSSNNSTTVTNGSGGPAASASVQGEVLGVSTLASTGSAEEVKALFMLLGGLSLVGFSLNNAKKEAA